MVYIQDSFDKFHLDFDILLLVPKRWGAMWNLEGSTILK